jgi:chitinase
MKTFSALMALSAWFLASSAQAYDCSSVAQYQEGSSYAAGTMAKNAGVAYKCNVGGWCSQGGAYAPGSGWAWENAWASLGACATNSAASSLAASVAPSSAAVVSSTPASSAAPSSTAACVGLANWDAASVYTKDNWVAAAGVKYQAKWWTQGQNPASNSGPDAVWVKRGQCDLSSQPASSAPASTAASSKAASSVAPSSVIASSVIANSAVASSKAVSSSAAALSSKAASSTASLGGKKVVGYFAEWGIYGRNYHVKNIETSGSAAILTHIVYAFGNVKNGQCIVGDSYADYDRAYSAAESVDGVADSWESTNVRGSFGQLRRLKAMHPGLKVVWSFGGWTWSGGFGQAAQNPAAFAESCYNLVKDPRWADVFDGIDIDWEYPNECGLVCDTSGFSSYKNLMQALRARFGSSALVTAAIGAGAAKINAADYAGAAQYVDFYMPMTYDFFGAWDKTGPTAPHSALTDFAGIPVAGNHSQNAIELLLSKGIPKSKLLLGVGFYGRGWTGVTQTAPGGSATGAAAGSVEPGIEDYKILKTKCPTTYSFAGTAYAKCGSEWWSFDTPASLTGKMDYVNQQNLGGTFFWELSGDTANGELIKVLNNVR